MTNLSRVSAWRSSPNDGVVLYGGGRVGQDVCRVLAEEGVRILFFLDRNAAVGDEVLGIPVVRPESCPLSPQDRARVPVVISIFNRSVDIPAVETTLRGLGFRRTIPFVDFHADFFDRLGDRFWLTDRRFVGEHDREIAAADTIWADELSRTIFRGLVALRESATYDDVVKPRLNDTQYFPADIPHWLRARPIRLIDCGAFDGDTLAAILRMGFPLGALALFEPDPENFKLLTRFVQDHLREFGAPVTLWPCAVGRACNIVNFRAGEDEGSSVRSDGQGTVQAVALDAVLCEWHPTFIKMDIEGAEVDALLGARQQIGQNRPDLAICIYHRPGHLWEIPLLLREWKELANYRYFLRVHGHDGFDTVLYALPEG